MSHLTKKVIVWHKNNYTTLELDPNELITIIYKLPQVKQLIRCDSCRAGLFMNKIVDADKNIILYMPFIPRNNFISKVYELPDSIRLEPPLTGGGMVQVWVDDEAIMFYNPNNWKDKITISSYHVSCKSDHIPKDSLNGLNMLGLILYRYNGKTDWYLNEMHCKSGYIVIVNEDKLKNIQTKRGTSHAKLYKLIFGMDTEDVDVEIIGAGFAINKGNYQFNSNTFNDNRKKDDWHNDNREMHPLERIAITNALDNWRLNQIQNTYIKDMKFANENECRWHTSRKYYQDK